MPDDFAEFKFGSDSLKALIKVFEIDRSAAAEHMTNFVAPNFVMNGKRSRRQRQFGDL